MGATTKTGRPGASNGAETKTPEERPRFPRPADYPGLIEAEARLERAAEVDDLPMAPQRAESLLASEREARKLKVGPSNDPDELSRARETLAIYRARVDEAQRRQQAERAEARTWCREQILAMLRPPESSAIAKARAALERAEEELAEFHRLAEAEDAEAALLRHESGPEDLEAILEHEQAAERARRRAELQEPAVERAQARLERAEHGQARRLRDNAEQLQHELAREFREALARIHDVVEDEELVRAAAGVPSVIPEQVRRALREPTSIWSHKEAI